MSHFLVKRWPPLTAAAVAATAVAVLLWPVLSGTMYLAAPDYLAQFYPYLDFSADLWKTEGVLPLYLPHLFGGMPFIASMNTAVLYPTECVGWLLGIPALTFYAWDAVFHHALAACGAVVLFTSGGLTPLAACAGGILYSLAGVTLTQLGVGSVNFHRGGAWLPVLVWAIWSGSQGNLRHAIFGGFVAGAMCLTYAVQLLAFGMLWAIAFCLVDRPRNWRGLVWALTVTGGTGMAIAAIWLLPAAGYWVDSTRRIAPEGFGSTWAMRFRDLSDLIRPSVPAGVSPPGEPDTPAKMSIAIGACAIALSALGLAASWKRRAAWLVAGALAIALSFGPGVFPGNLVALLPGFSGFRGWGRWIQLAMLAVSVFAAEGLEAMVRTGKRTAGLGRQIVGGVTGMFLAAMILELMWGARPFISTLPVSKLAIEDQVGDFLAAQKGTFRTQSEEEDRHISWRMSRGLEFLSGHHTIPSQSIFRYAGAAVQSGNPYPHLGRMNCRFVVTTEPRPNPSLKLFAVLRGVTGATRWVYVNRHFRERVFSVQRHRAVHSDEEALRSTITRRWILDEVSLTEHPEPMRTYTRARIYDVRSRAGQISATVEASGQALVTVAEIADSAWRVTLDGSRCQAWRADGVLMAVAIPAGRHRLALNYDPLSFRVGLWLSLVAVAALVIIMSPRIPQALVVHGKDDDSRDGRKL